MLRFLCWGPRDHLPTTCDTATACRAGIRRHFQAIPTYPVPSTSPRRHADHQPPPACVPELAAIRVGIGCGPWCLDTALRSRLRSAKQEVSQHASSKLPPGMKSMFVDLSFNLHHSTCDVSTIHFDSVLARKLTLSTRPIWHATRQLLTLEAVQHSAERKDSVRRTSVGI